MWRYIGVLVLVVACAGQIAAQDRPEKSSTISERLSDAKNVGLVVNEKLGGFSLFVYTAQQDAKNRETLDKHKEEWATLAQRQKEAQDRLNEAAGRGASADVIKVLIEERDRLPTYPFRNDLQLYRVVHVAKDHIELEALFRPDGTSVVPFNRLIQIHFPQTPASTRY